MHLALARSRRRRRRASDRLGLNASHVRLAVSEDGKRALVTYRAGGKTRHALVWGACNALPPSQTVPQVRFKIDWTGGWETYGHTVWRQLRQRLPAVRRPAARRARRRVQGARRLVLGGAALAAEPPAPRLPAVQGGPDRLGARRLALDGRARAARGARRLGLQRAGAQPLRPADSTAASRCTASTPCKGTGAPQDRYGRSLYIDTLDSAYGAGWKRETSIVFRNPTGVFCYSFWPTHDVSLPGQPARPAGYGSAYRIEVLGPGVTPNLVATVDDPGRGTRTTRRRCGSRPR